MNVVILGAGYAGIIAALRLARGAGDRLHITVVNRDDRFVERIRLHEAAVGRSLPVLSVGHLLAHPSIRVVLGQASRVDLDARTVGVGAQQLSWDRLVVALGSRTAMTVPGSATHTIPLEPALLQHALPARGRIVVVGGGMTGIEAATEIAEAWPEARVALLTRGTLGAELGDRARAHLHRACARLGLEVIEHANAERVESNALHTDGGALAFDACVWSPGFLGSALPEGLDLPQNERGQIRVDATLRAQGHPHVRVAGDLAAVDAPIPIPMGCKSALPAGAHVADELLRELRGEAPRPFDFVTPLYCMSLGRRDGIVHFTRKNGRLEGPVVTGRLAAFIKEQICRYTRLTFRLERLGLGNHAVYRAGNVGRDALLGA